MEKETQSSKPPKPNAEEKAIATIKEPTVCELCGATSEHVEIVTVGIPGEQRFRGICEPHWSLISQLVKEIIYDAFFVDGLESWLAHYKGGSQ